MGAVFILIGEICKPWIDILTNRKAMVKDAAIIIITSLCVLLSVHFNYENVLMYLNQYGNYGWFILGSMSGIIMVIIISNFIYQTLSRNKRFLYQLVMWVGFNSLVVFPVHLLINSNLQVLYDMIGRGTAPIRLLMMFALGIPICNFITNYMPWMIGMPKKKIAK